MVDIPIPSLIYCPKCGNEMNLEKIVEAQTQVELEESGYATGARGICPCGVTAILAIKKMPENPTFTLMFNIYKLKIERR